MKSGVALKGDDEVMRKNKRHFVVRFGSCLFFVRSKLYDYDLMKSGNREKKRSMTFVLREGIYCGNENGNENGNRKE